MSKVEEVARAIEPETFELPRINLYREAYDRAHERARRAIAAMREPSEAMVDAAAPAHSGERVMHTVAFRLMIDAALQE